MIEYRIIYGQSAYSVSNEANQLAKSGWKAVNISMAVDRGNRENFAMLLSKATNDTEGQETP